MTKRFQIACNLFLFALLLSSGPALAERRVAMVVGNGAYQSVAPLRNPEKDADAVAGVLTKLDFDVLLIKDVDKPGLETALRHFREMAEGADVAAFYYSGHAFAAGDRNYLVPVTAVPGALAAHTLDMGALQDVSALLRSAGAKTQVLILDACRDNPFGTTPEGSTEPIGQARGLAPVRAPVGSLVVFSTGPGQVAYDGGGALSPFTQAFVDRAPTPNLEVRQVISRVRAEVADATSQRQLPWDDSSLLGDLYLVPKRQPPSFDHFAATTVPDRPGTWLLQLKEPVQPAGGKIRINVDHPPDHGQVILDGHPVLPNFTIDGQALARLSYEPDDTKSTTDAFSFQIGDDWGHQEVGLVSIARKPDADRTRVSDPVLPVGFGTVQVDATALVGIGPNLVWKTSLPPNGAPSETRLELTSEIEGGQLFLNDRVLGKGQSISFRETRLLTFIPQAGSAGNHIDLNFRTERGAGDLKIGIDIAITECDRLAGDVVDPQGVTTGVPIEKINASVAIPACDVAVRAMPKEGRFELQLGRALAAGARNQEAMQAFEKARELHHVRALQALGYRHCNVIPIDCDLGRRELEEGVDGDDPAAMNTLAWLYMQGKYVPRDHDRARELFEAAARVGLVASMNALGTMYATADSVAQDPARARRYFQEAARRGDRYGLLNMGFVFLNGIGGDKDAVEALHYFERAAGAGAPEAANDVGRLYLLGLGVKVDPGEAVRWYRKGAEAGDGWASYNLAELERVGKGVPANLTAAAADYAVAAGSPKDPDLSELAIKALGQLSATVKTGALRSMLASNGIHDATSLSLPMLFEAARQTATTNSVRISGDSLDALLSAVGQVDWLRRVKRTDVF